MTIRGIHRSRICLSGRAPVAVEIDQHLPFGNLKGFDFDIQAGADFIDYPIDSPS